MRTSLVARFILTLQDRLSGPLQAVRRRIEALRQLAGRVAVVSTALAGLSIAGPIQGAAALETRLRDVAITAGLTGDQIRAAVQGMRGEINELANLYRLSTTNLLGAAEVLTARGLGAEEVREYTRVIAQVAAGSGAAEAELAQLSVAFNRIAGISSQAGQMTAFAQALRAGQLGGAELRDMAQHFPTVLGSMQALGVTGPRAVQNAAAMFQVLRDGFGTTEAAAAGLNQLLGQLMSESTVRAAQELGVNIPRIYQSAMQQAARGVDIDPVEAIFQALRRGLAGRQDQIFSLMQDQNARQAFLAWQSGVERYVSIRNELRNTSFDVVQSAVRDRTQGLGADFRQTQELVGQLSDRLGDGLGGALARVNPLLEQMVGWVRETDQAFPGLIDGTLSFAAGAVGIAGALGAVSLAAKPVGALLAALLSPFVLIGTVAAGVAIYIYKEYRNLTLTEIVARICRPYGIAVRAEVDVGAPFARFAIEVGETAISAIEKACRQRAVLAVSDGVGGLVLTRGGKAPAPALLVFGANIQTMDATFDWAERFSLYIVRGQAERPQAQGIVDAAPITPGAPPATAAPGARRPGPTSPAGERPRIAPTGRAEDPAVGRYRPTVAMAKTQSGGVSVQEQADWMMRTARAKSDALRVAVPYWRAGEEDRLWRCNERVVVDDPLAGVSHELLIAGITWRWDEGAARTELRLCGCDAFDILPEAEQRERARRPGGGLTEAEPVQQEAAPVPRVNQ